MKPSWDDAPEWANYLFWDKYGESWVWCSKKPRWSILHWKYEPSGAWIWVHTGNYVKWSGSGRDTLESRP